MATTPVNDGEKEVFDAIALMPDQDRRIAERLHEIITKSAPGLLPRTWYGMPAYNDGSKIICFVRTRKKFGERYMTLGFNDSARLDEGTMWPVYFAITELSPKDETRVAELVKQAVQNNK